MVDQRVPRKAGGFPTIAQNDDPFRYRGSSTFRSCARIIAVRSSGAPIEEEKGKGCGRRDSDYPFSRVWELIPMPLATQRGIYSACVGPRIGTVLWHRGYRAQPQNGFSASRRTIRTSRLQ